MALPPACGYAATAAPATQPALSEILSPSQGRPVFCTPSNTFACLLHLSARIGDAPRMWLQNSQLPKLRYPLMQVGGLATLGEGYASTHLSVPSSVPPGIYDLVVAGAAGEAVSRRSVSVVSSYKTSFRFVHLSNMNIGDPTAIEFDPQLPDEVNILAPEFIVATGDFTEWARLADSAADWQRVLDYMARFDAPVYIVCGDHDHEASFTRHVANSLVGTIDYGNYHGLLLLDHGYHPVERDDDQIQWILADLAENRHKTFNFIVTHSDELGLLHRLKEMGAAERVIRDGKVKMLLCGGHTDWDYKEFSSVLAGLPGLNFIRTAQSSTAVCDKAPGVSHYRVIEVSNERISYVYPADYLDARVQNSVPAGRIRTFFDGPNDGSRKVVGVNISNGLNRPWNDCRVWLRVAKDRAGTQPAVAGGTVVRCLDAGAYWAVLAGFDLPDKGAVTLQAGSPEQLVPASPVHLEIQTHDQLFFTQRYAGFGLAYYTCSSPVVLRVVNRSQQAVRVWPIVRLNGTNLPLSSPEPLPLTLMPMASQMLRVALTLGHVSLGPHMLQVYLLDDPLRRLETRQVVLLMEPEPAMGPLPTSPPAEGAASQPATSQPAAAP